MDFELPRTAGELEDIGFVPNDEGMPLPFEDEGRDEGEGEEDAGGVDW